MVAFDHLVACARKAALGKRHRPDVQRFLIRLERNVIAIQRALVTGTWRPGHFHEFVVREPKSRLISAAPFRDRVVHHALVGALEPVFERAFIHHSYACRRYKGTHRAVRQYQQWARSHRYVLKMDVRKFFPSIDHEVLLSLLARKIKDRRVLDLAAVIVAGSNAQEPVPELDALSGAEPVTRDRRRGLPIGNQTSQFFANVMLDPLDQFITRRLGLGRYLRYVDDLVVLSNSKDELHLARASIEAFAAERLRLCFHPGKCFVSPVEEGLRLLGYRVYPRRIRLARENVVRARRRLRRAAREVELGRLLLESLTASVSAWVGHARHADAERLREQVLSQICLRLPDRAADCEIAATLGKGR